MSKRKRSRAMTTSRRASTKGSALMAVPDNSIEGMIMLLRGERVILDADLGGLYGVPTRALNQAVKRNLERFPADFMFLLTSEEAARLRSQTVTSKSGRGGRRYTPYAFTEHGAIMAANVLNSPRAVRASVFVVRAFVRLRRMLFQHKELAARLDELERKLEGHDRQIIALVDAIRQLMAPPQGPPRRRIGFQSEAEQ